MNRIFIYILLFFLVMGGTVFAQKEKKVSPIMFKDGMLFYISDSLGNRIPDFSYAGYKAGEIPIPQPKPTIVVPISDEDATGLIQQAIDYIGTLQADRNGFRGVVLLEQGDYRVSGSIFVRHSGVILRGNGMGNTGTRLIATGKDRRTLIQIIGKSDIEVKKSVEIASEYVPVNALSLTVKGSHSFRKGDKIFIHRPSTQEWINTLGTDHFGGGITSLGWKAGDKDIYWDRTIVDIQANQIIVDAPLTTAIEKKYGGGYIIPYKWDGRIENVGIENLSCVSEYDINNLKDEEHAWMAVTMENVKDAWVRNMTFTHFAGSAVYISESAKRITVENCKSFSPVSEIGGQRRYTFFTAGQQCLFQRLYAEEGYHDFAVGHCAAGPNAFVQCESNLPYSFSGPVDSWASGVLFDIVNVNGNALSYKNRMQEAQGTGWNAANSVFWQCSASLIECFSPPTAYNWSFGSWAEFSGNGYWSQSNNHINPRSLYYAQLKDRLKEKYVDNSDLLPVEAEASSSPTAEIAAELTKKAYYSPMTLSEWIDKVIEKNKIPIETEDIKIFTQNKNNTIVSQNNIAALSIVNGRLVRDGVVQTGQRYKVQWWSGNVRPIFLTKNAGPHLTRFVPGRTGLGLTDIIDSVAYLMKKGNILTFDHNYGLWYDRRRDDHERIRRINGEVWPPFYEQPFARSGIGTAYDGLSKYDLTKYNDWYWNRLRRFADIADKDGLVLLHQNYFQHNIIEAGAHWTDSPWRPANNINDTGFPEPVPYAGDKRIFLAEQFYDITHPVRRELHRAYIRQCLENFRGSSSVIQLISEEYTGPLHFVEFWLDVIAEWKAETGEKPLIALSTTKDVQDAILADPVRSQHVDIVDIRYWLYRADGTAYEPKGGQNLAPRQHARLIKPGKVSFNSVYRAVSEYRLAYPEKAVVYYSDSYPQYSWACFMAEGSFACLPKINDSKFLKNASSMQIRNDLNMEGQYVLANPALGYIIYSENERIKINLPDTKSKYEVYWIDAETGNIIKDKIHIKGGSNTELVTRSKVLWLLKK